MTKSKRHYLVFARQDGIPFGSRYHHIKALHDIDTFFNSRLRGNIVIRWSNTEEIALVGSLRNKKEVSGECFGLSSPKEDLRQTTVYLNAEMILSQPTACEEMWQIVFHELMVSRETGTFIDVQYLTNRLPTLARSFHSDNRYF